MPVGQRAPAEHLAQILEFWRTGLSEKTAAGMLGYSAAVCSRAVRGAGLPARRPGKRLYHFNEGYFSEVTTPEQAHVLGLIATDGCVRKGYVQLNLQRSDRGHMEKINAALESNVPIHDYEKVSHKDKVKPYSVVQYYSARMVADLARLGIGPRKTWTVHPCFSPDHPLAGPFWQGCVDGDGSIYHGRAEKRKNAWCIAYCGNRHMVAGFVRFVRSRLGVRPSEVRRVRRVRVVVYAAFKRTQPLARLLYEGATLWMDRKKAKADALLATVPHVPRWAHLTRAELEQAYAQRGEWKLVAADLDMHPMSLASVRRRLGMPFEPRRR